MKSMNLIEPAVAHYTVFSHRSEPSRGCGFYSHLVSMRVRRVHPRRPDEPLSEPQTQIELDIVEVRKLFGFIPYRHTSHATFLFTSTQELQQLVAALTRLKTAPDTVANYANDRTWVNVRRGFVSPRELTDEAQRWASREAAMRG